MTKPITPNEVNGPDIPDAVIEVFNELIRRSFDGRHAMIRQEAVVKAIMAKLGCTERDVFNGHYLDVEPIYRQAGWVVKYEKPSIDENFEPYFEFRK